ncbi:hypothetical protein Tco_0267773 [Tanacetum coccineum]
MKTIHVQFDELTKQMDPVQLSTGPAPMFLTPGQISLGLVPNSVHAAPYVPPTNKELEILFQPMFDEYLDPPYVEKPVSPALVVPVPVNSAGTSSSTTIDQDAPSPTKLQIPSMQGLLEWLQGLQSEVGSNGNLLWEAFVLLNEKKRGLLRMCKSKEEYESHVKIIVEPLKKKEANERWKKIQMGNEPILALPEGADDFVVYCDARRKDLEAFLDEGGEGDC